MKVALNWEDGAKLDKHTTRKHKILREYLRDYLNTRCQHPRQEKFRLAMIDGFSGAGRYACGGAGSPVIMLEVLRDTVNEINERRAAENMRQISVECFLIFNDGDPIAISQLKNNVAGYIAEAKNSNNPLYLNVEFHQRAFVDLYPEIKARILSGRYPNVVFNLDQYGYSDAPIGVLRDIMGSWGSAEIFLTFAIETIRTFLSEEREKNQALLGEKQLLDEIYASLADGAEVIGKKRWLGVAEKVVFEHLKNIAPFVSPFSIHNPDGWRYWLIHFANVARARQVYNDVLHENSSQQAHFGHSGLNMLAYNPESEGALYLFDYNSRADAKKELHTDIPKRLSEFGDASSIDDFYRDIYKETAAHSDDIQTVIFENDDIEVLTPVGNERQKSHTIRPTDTIRLKSQKFFFRMFPNKA